MDTSKFKGIPIYDPNDDQFILVPTDCDGTIVDVIYRKGKGGQTREERERIQKEKEARGDRHRDPGFSYIPELNHRTYEAAPGITCMQDECCVLRDGVKIYADIYL